jgi:hypothetical protein
MADDSMMVTVACPDCGETREERWSRDLADRAAGAVKVLREVVPDSKADPYSHMCEDCMSKTWQPPSSENKEWW